MAKAKKLPSGNWRVRASFTDEDGVQHTESFTRPTKREAEYEASKWLMDRKERKRDRETNGMTVEEAIDMYIDTCECRGLSPTTIDTYLKHKRNALKPLLGMRVNKMTKEIIQKEINARSAGHSAKTVKNEFGLLVTVLGVYNEDLNLTKLVYPESDSEEMEIPEDDGVKRLLEAAKENTDFYLAVLLASILGLRRSEICALEWSDVDFTNGLLSITKALVKDKDNCLVLKKPKTKSGRRTVSIPDGVLNELRAARQLGGRIVRLSPDAVTRRYERLREQLGITCRFHDLRHYHASVMLALNVPMKYIMADMGHATPDMVNKVYGHRMAGKQKVIDSNMARHADSILSGNDFDYSLPRKLTRYRGNVAK